MSNIKNKEQWLSSNNVPQYLKDELIAFNDEQLNFAFNNKLEFGTAGIRANMGPGNGLMNILTIRQTTIAYAKFLLTNNTGELSVIIGHDNRFHGEEFALEAARVLSSFGIKTYLPKGNKLVSTPFISQAVKRMSLTGGIMLTASHNPKEDNGFKAYNSFGGQLLPQDTSVISKNMNNIENILDISIEFNEKLIVDVPTSVYDEYINDLLSLIPLHQELDKKVDFVYTPLHGTGTELMPMLFEKLGYKLTCVKEQMEHDPNFASTKSSNPEEEVAFEKSIEVANKNNISRILATDPDADRLAVAEKINGEWYLYSGNEIGILYTWYLINELKPMPKKPLIASTIVSTSFIDKLVKNTNIEIKRVPTGFKWIAQIMENEKDKSFILGFEESTGATMNPMTRDKDSHQAAIFVADMMNFYAQDGKTLKDVLSDIYVEYGHSASQTFSIKLANTSDWKQIAGKKMDFLRKPTFDQIAGFKFKEITEDKETGVLSWMFDNNSWVKFRLSGTEPKFKIYVYIDNAKDEKEANEMKNNLFNKIKESIT